MERKLIGLLLIIAMTLFTFWVMALVSAAHAAKGEGVVTVEVLTVEDLNPDEAVTYCIVNPYSAVCVATPQNKIDEETGEFYEVILKEVIIE